MISKRTFYKNQLKNMKDLNTQTSFLPSEQNFENLQRNEVDKKAHEQQLIKEVSKPYPFNLASM